MGGEMGEALDIVDVPDDAFNYADLCAAHERLKWELDAERAALAEIQYANAELREQLEQVRAETAAAFDWLADELSGAQMHADCGGRFIAGDDPARVFNSAIADAIDLTEQAKERAGVNAGAALLARLDAAEKVAEAAGRYDRAKLAFDGVVS
jgi:hypothetical protein